MIEKLIAQNEGKTFELKENTKSLPKIIQTIIAFANTSGGTILVGVKDRTKEVVGIANILNEEERIANAIADSIEPLLTPNLQLCSWRNRDLLVIHVPYSIGPFYSKSKGMINGTFIRFGSTNRLADQSTIDAIIRSKQHLFYDELPCHQTTENDLKLDMAKGLFQKVNKKFTKSNAKSLGILVLNQEHLLPSIGGILLFGDSDKRKEIFPNAMVRCAKFEGIKKINFVDKLDIHEPLPFTVDLVLEFIKKHTTIGYEIGNIRGKELPQYPPKVIREAVINSIVHADYSVKGSSIQVAIFDDRIEITNPGMLPFGLSMETALSGFSQLRNKIIGQSFRELQIIESWGTGLGRMKELCQKQGIPEPHFEEVDNYFKVTLFHKKQLDQIRESWEIDIIKHIDSNGEITAKNAQKLWKVTSRTTSSRLKKMVKDGTLVEIGTGPYDPFKTFMKT